MHSVEIEWFIVKGIELLPPREILNGLQMGDIKDNAVGQNLMVNSGVVKFTVVNDHLQLNSREPVSNATFVRSY